MMIFRLNLRTAQEPLEKHDQCTYYKSKST